jgi:DNA invertase Pin-like site-specific DNA recombinase
MDGIKLALEQGTRFGRKPILTAEAIAKVRALRTEGTAISEIIRRTGLSKASIYRALSKLAPDLAPN